MGYKVTVFARSVAPVRGLQKPPSISAILAGVSNLRPELEAGSSNLGACMHETYRGACKASNCTAGKVITKTNCTATGCVNGKITTTKACTRSGCVNGYITTSYNCSAHGYRYSHYYCSRHGNSVSQYHG